MASAWDAGAGSQTAVEMSEQATLAKQSADAAATSATSASNSASAAAQSATDATNNGAAQVSLATTQANNAATSATNASNSATAASNSAIAASNSATNANTSATNAATSATNAGNSASSASSSATAAQNAAASGLYKTVDDKSANYAVVATDDGALIRMNTGASSVTVTLPLISTLTANIRITVAKITADTNTATVAASGSNTVNGASNYVLSNQYAAATFISDIVNNNWEAIGTGNPLVDGSVTTAKLADGSVTNAKIAANAVTPDKLNLSGSSIMGRNKLINGNFDIWQRGTSFTATGYTADRWTVNLNGATATISRQAFALGQGVVPNEPTYFLRVNQTVAAASELDQLIESVRTLAGQTVTISLWAKAAAAMTFTPNLHQNFGTGGSPSAGVTTNGSPVALTTAWQKFTQSYVIPSIAGKTLGTDGNDSLTLRAMFPSSLFTFDIAQVQLERGSVATDFEQRPISQELALCQRYYQFLQVGWLGSSTSGSAFGQDYSFPTMRTTPTITLNTDLQATNFPAGLPATDYLAPYALRAYKTASATGTGAWQDIIQLSAEL